MNGDFTVLTPEQEDRLLKLEEFYATILRLAQYQELYKQTPVYEALSKVNPQWNREASIWYDLESRN